MLGVKVNHTLESSLWKGDVLKVWILALGCWFSGFTVRRGQIPDFRSTTNQDHLIKYGQHLARFNKIFPRCPPRTNLDTVALRLCSEGSSTWTWYNSRLSLLVHLAGMWNTGSDPKPTEEFPMPGPALRFPLWARQRGSFLLPTHSTEVLGWSPGENLQGRNSSPWALGISLGFCY